MYQPALRDTDRPGILTVCAHGSPRAVNDFSWLHKYGDPLSPEQLAEKIRDSGQFSPGMPIWLKACNTGSKEGNFAQSLAKILNTTVFAPDNFLVKVEAILGAAQGWYQHLQLCWLEPSIL